MIDSIDQVIDLICNRIYAQQYELENQSLSELIKTLAELVNAKANLNLSKRMSECSEQDNHAVNCLISSDSRGSHRTEMMTGQIIHRMNKF